MTTVGDVKAILKRLYDLVMEFVELVKKLFGAGSDDSSTTQTY